MRVLTLLNALAMGWYRFEDFRHPAAAVLALVGLTAWTTFALWAYRAAPRRTDVLLVADLSVALGLLLATPWLKGEGFAATVPGFWVMGPVLAWSAHWRWRGGLIAGAVLAACDLAIRDHWSQSNIGNAFLLVIGGPVVGYLSGLLQQLAAERDRAQAEAAASAERARLARAVHDGVLQVLALMQRRGPELGPDGATLGALAGEQEAALRRMIQAQEVLVPGADADLGTALAALADRPRVQVSAPADAVRLPAAAVGELVAAVGACLDNTARHAGSEASSWVLVEAMADRVVVTVRDDGPGIAPGRVDQAAGEGRLGVSESIRGRLADLGGTARLTSGSFGTEWELSLPLR